MMTNLLHAPSWHEFTCHSKQPIFIHLGHYFVVNSMAFTDLRAFVSSLLLALSYNIPEAF